MPQIDIKIVGVATLIVGLLIGFYIDNSLVSKPKIDSLNQMISEHNTTINNLQIQHDTLEDEFESLQELYIQLSEQYDEQKDTLENTITQQETQIENLQVLINSLESIINEKDAKLISLETEIDYYKTKYESEINPLYIVFTYDELEINFTITTDTYPENNYIKGTVTIKYTNGVPFYGTFRLNLYKVYSVSGTTSDTFAINEEKTYTWNNPFVLGPGSYKISLLEIKDTEGNTVIPDTFLSSKVIYLFEG